MQSLRHRRPCCRESATDFNACGAGNVEAVDRPVLNEKVCDLDVYRIAYDYEVIRPEEVSIFFFSKQGGHSLGNTSIRALTIPICLSVAVNNCACLCCYCYVCSAKDDRVKAVATGRAESLRQVV